MFGVYYPFLYKFRLFSKSVSSGKLNIGRSSSGYLVGTTFLGFISSTGTTVGSGIIGIPLISVILGSANSSSVVFSLLLGKVCAMIGRMPSLRV